MRFHRDEGHDILSANDMMDAITERCTNQRIKCCVVNIDNKKSDVTNITKIDGISNIHSVEILRESLRVWNFYDIGKGSEVRLKNCNFVSGAKVIRTFEDVHTIHNNNTTTKTGHKSTFFCENCKLCFVNDIEYEQHLLENISKTCDSREAISNWDKTIKIYTSNNMTNNSTSSNVKQQNIRSETFETTFEHSWAVKKQTRSRFTKEQKEFLDRCFIAGAKSGKYLILLHTARNQ